MPDRRPRTLRQFDRVVATLRPVRTDDLAGFVDVATIMPGGGAGD
jgi:hypothetical protein